MRLSPSGSVLLLFATCWVTTGCSGEDEVAATGDGGASSSAGGSDGGGGSGASGGTAGAGGSGAGGGAGGMATTLEIVVAGQTDSTDLPGRLNDFLGGTLDGLVARVDVPLDGSGATLAWSRHIGGSALEQVRDVAVDASGRAFITGRMASPDFATTAGVLQSTYAGGGMDAFLARIENDGSVGYATYFGGDSYDVGYGITIAASGSLVLSGRTSSTDLPVSNDAAQATYGGGGSSAPYFGGDFFAFSLAADGSAVDWGTYAGGSGDDMGRGRNAIDGDGAVWVGGRTESNNFPVTGTLSGQSDGAVVKIAADGASILGGRLIGGGAQFDAATGAMLALPDGTVLVCGYTSSADFPASANAAQDSHGGGFDGMIAHLSADGTQVLAATYVGGGTYEECQGVDVLPNGDIVAVGITTSSDFPFTSGSLSGSGDLWLARLTPDLQTFVWNIPVGASGNESNDASRVWATSAGILVVGATDSADLPVTSDAFQSSFGGGTNDIFITVQAEDGSGPSFMSYFGGSGEDFPRAVAFREK